MGDGEWKIWAFTVSISQAEIGNGKRQGETLTHIPPFPLAQGDYHSFNSASRTADKWSQKTGESDGAHPLNSPLALPH